MLEASPWVLKEVNLTPQEPSIAVPLEEASLPPHLSWKARARAAVLTIETSSPGETFVFVSRSADFPSSITKNELSDSLVALVEI